MHVSALHASAMTKRFFHLPTHLSSALYLALQKDVIWTEEETDSSR